MNTTPDTYLYEFTQNTVRGQKIDKLGNHTNSAVIFGNTLQYEHLSNQLDRITFDDIQSIPTVNFQNEFPSLLFKSPIELYKLVVEESHILIYSERICELLSSYYKENIRLNLNNLYSNAPKFFSEQFLGNRKTASFEIYQKYIFVISLIIYINKYYNTPDIRTLPNIDITIEWCRIRRDPNLEYILSGPTQNQNINIDYKTHYQDIMSQSNTPQNISDYSITSTTKIISNDVLNISNHIQAQPNTYHKNPDIARNYKINITSPNNVRTYLDDTQLVFDLSNVNLGDTTETGTVDQSRIGYNEITTEITNNKVNPIVSSGKLEEIFHNYTTLRINKLKVHVSNYKTDLTAFSQLYVIIRGVNADTRGPYNTFNTLCMFSGRFIREGLWYVFLPDVQGWSYRPMSVNVNKFELLITTDPDNKNLLIPNQPYIQTSYNNIFNKLIYTGIPHKPRLVRIKEVVPDKIHNYVKNIRKCQVGGYNPSTGNYGLFTPDELLEVRKSDKLKDLLLLIVKRDIITYNIDSDVNWNNIGTLLSYSNNTLNPVERIVPMYRKSIMAYIIQAILNLPNPLEDILNLLSTMLYISTPDWENLSFRITPKDIPLNDNKLGATIPPSIRNILGNTMDQLYGSDLPPEVKNLLNVNDMSRVNVYQIKNYIENLTANTFMDYSNPPTIDKIQEYINNFNTVMSVLISKRDDTKIMTLRDKNVWKKVMINPISGTINNRSFDIDEHGDVVWTKNTILKYVEYSPRDNDLTLVNYYKLEVVDGIPQIVRQVGKSKFVSQRLKLEKEVGDIPEASALFNDKFRFDDAHALHPTIKYVYNVLELPDNTKETIMYSELSSDGTLGVNSVHIIPNNNSVDNLVLPPDMKPTDINNNQVANNILPSTTYNCEFINDSTVIVHGIDPKSIIHAKHIQLVPTHRRIMLSLEFN